MQPAMIQEINALSPKTPNLDISVTFEIKAIVYFATINK